MAISETKRQRVIANYFKDECDVNTSIRQAFEKGFRIGVKKGASTNRPQGEWLDYEIPLEDGGAMPIQVCNLCKTFYPLAYTGGGHRFCPNCGAKMSNASNASNTLETLEKGETE